jgi:hypothetical protein
LKRTFFVIVRNMFELFSICADSIRILFVCQLFAWNEDRTGVGCVTNLASEADSGSRHPGDPGGAISRWDWGVIYAVNTRRSGFEAAGQPPESAIGVFRISAFGGEDSVRAHRHRAPSL